MTAQQVKNALQDVGMHVSLSTVKKRPLEHNPKGFTIRCEPLVRLQKEKGQIAAHKKETS